MRSNQGNAWSSAYCLSRARWVGTGGRTRWLAGLPPNVVSLTRFATQQLYSPTRLLEENSNIYRTPMYTQKSVVLTRGDSLAAFPLISWRGGDLYVTAVLLRNNLHQAISINPNSFLGCWQSISVYPLTTLSAMGSQGDRSTVFLVSSAPFGDALKQNCQVSRHDVSRGGSLLSVFTLFDGQLFTIIDGCIGSKINKHSATAMLVHWAP